MPIDYVITGMSDDESEQSAEDIHRQILALLQQFNRQDATDAALDVATDAKDKAKPTRRDFVVGGAALLASGALIVGGGGTAVAQATPEGNVGSASNPALKVYTDVFHFNERTSDPSSPDDGSMWYNSSA